MADNVLDSGAPSAKRPKLSSPALSVSASDGNGKYLNAFLILSDIKLLMLTFVYPLLVSSGSHSGVSHRLGNVCESGSIINALDYVSVRMFNLLKKTKKTQPMRFEF